jgi:hypothetical protein
VPDAGVYVGPVQSWPLAFDIDVVRVLQLEGCLTIAPQQAGRRELGRVVVPVLHIGIALL